MSALALDAEALYQQLLRGVRSLCQPQTRLVGITSGGAWLAERLQRDLGLEGESGQVSSVMHRDDYAQRGLAAGGQTQLPFEIEGADISARLDLAFAEVDDFLAFRDFLPDGLVRVQAVAGLIDVAHLHRLTDAQRAGVRFFLAGDHAEQGRLAGTVRAYDADDSARRQLEEIGRAHV